MSINKSDIEKLLERQDKGTQHRKEVKSCRTEHKCKAKPCLVNDNAIIEIGEPAVVITSIINTPYTNKEIYSTKYYHMIMCEPKNE